MTLDIRKEPKVKAYDVPMFVSLCDEQDIAIIGMEGGSMTAEGFIPDLNLIADLSKRNNLMWQEFKRKSNQGALLFLKAVNFSQETVFVMTIIDEKEFNQLYGINI